MQPIKIQTLRLTRYIDILAGSSRPILGAAKDASGQETEVVVKLVGSLKRGTFSRSAELIGALLARDLGLKTAEPVFVDISANFQDSVQDKALADVLKRSPGLNFGVKKLERGSITWPIESTRQLSDDFLEEAPLIFGFDITTQNFDRKKDNPNLLQYRREIVLYDHEMAFSSLWNNPGAPTLDKLEFDTFYGHVFYYQEALSKLREATTELAARLGRMTETRLVEYQQVIPAAWQAECDSTDRILEYIRWVCEHRSQIVTEIQNRFL